MLWKRSLRYDRMQSTSSRILGGLENYIMSRLYIQYFNQDKFEFADNGERINLLQTSLYVLNINTKTCEKRNMPIKQLSYLTLTETMLQDVMNTFSDSHLMRKWGCRIFLSLTEWGPEILEKVLKWKHEIY